MNGAHPGRKLVMAGQEGCCDPADSNESIIHPLSFWSSSISFCNTSMLASRFRLLRSAASNNFRKSPWYSFRMSAAWTHIGIRTSSLLSCNDTVAVLILKL